MPNHDDDSGRRADGKFRRGFCPDPKGPPHKAKADLRQQLTAILEEEVMAGGQPMSMFEVLFRTYCKEACKNPRLLMRLLPLLMTNGSNAEPAHEASFEEDQATIEAFRQAERDRARRQTSTDQQDDGDADD